MHTQQRLLPVQDAERKSAMNGLIAVAAFAGLLYVFARWLRLWIVRYEITASSIRIRAIGLPILRIQYARIQSCELVKASKLWQPWRLLFFRTLWLHTRFFVDGAVIKTRWFRYVMTPDDPVEFVRIVSERVSSLAKLKSQT